MTGVSLLVLLILLLLLTSSTPSAASPSMPPSFNLSHYLLSPISDDLVNHPHRSDSQPKYSPFFKDVLKEIAARERWDLEELSVSKLDVKKAKLGDLQRYEFRVRFGKSEFVFKLLDQVSRWKRFEQPENELGFEDLVSKVTSKAAVLGTLKIQGPFHLRLAGDHQLKLFLPLNNSFSGLKDILVGEGITVEVTGAEAVSLLHTTSASSSLERSDSRYFWPSSCMAWPPIRLVGSATVVAYRNRNPEAFIKTVLLSNRTVELLPEKCYDRRMFQMWDRDSYISSLSTRISLLERVLQTFLGHKTDKNVSLGFVKVKITASFVFRFQLELERVIQSNDPYWSTLAEWRTKPTVELAWFEVVGRLDREVLKPLSVKKIRPFIDADSKAWSNLMSNISFTKFPSILVPQEALTLDVKW